ncbi:hypothetical protein A9P82_00895 [Arachidicoccus ginsenosidimutans]|uniref:M15 family metallopeptidase n=1 Tax=Arachidicoccus sp. BS20 TaxID=1850526 RepID=UPI0007F1646A|nr:M15 family metallopeptidase [Arachidicoccus sp. BS20]ANI88000.1 hypothetical protein A9P82_00895 [Arachidicoccus sp. BS20]
MDKKSVFLPLLIFVFSCGTNVRLNAQTYTKNKYGLEIINDVHTYQKAIDNNPNEQLVLLTDYVPHLKTDFVYATKHNFTHTILYKNPKPYALLATAKALAQAAKDLKTQGFGILLFDGYRPYSITEKMWQVVPDARYAADPKFGSGHNKGVAVDITLYNLQDGKPLQMPTGFDNFTDTAHSDFMNLPDNVLHNRKLLKDVMNKYGFTQLSTEWWHFSINNPNNEYKILDLSFDELNKHIKSK